MFSEKEKSVKTNVHVFHKLLEAAIQGVLLKAILKKFVKFTRKLPLWSPPLWSPSFNLTIQNY